MIIRLMVAFCNKFREAFLFHKVWYNIKLKQLMDKGLTEQEARKVYKAQSYLKHKGIIKFFVFKGRK